MRLTGTSTRITARLAVVALVALAGVWWLSGCEDDPLAPWLEAPPDYLTGWGTFGLADGHFHSPSGIAADPAGNILVLDTNYRRVQKFTAEGAFLAVWPITVDGDPEGWYPFGLTVSSVGDVYIADGRHGVLRFSADGEKRPDPGCGSVPFGLAAGPGGAVYALETRFGALSPSEIRYTSTILVISPQGAVVDSLALPSFLVDGQSATPSEGWTFNSLAVDRDGNFYVAGNEREYLGGETTVTTEFIWKFDSEGRTLKRPLFRRSKAGGRLMAFEGMGVDSEGFIYVADSAGQVIRKIDQDGHIASQWDDVSPNYDDLDQPVGLCVDSQDHIYVTDWKFRRVVKYGYPDRNLE